MLGKKHIGPMTLSSDKHSSPANQQIGSSNNSGAPIVFDRLSVKKHRNRAAQNFGDHSFLKTRAAEDIADRLEVIPRPFKKILDIGSHTGEVEAELRSRPSIAERLGVVIKSDLSPKFATQSGELSVAADEEFLPFKPASFDAALSSLALHWVNDLPGALVQIRNALIPDGLFIAQLLGGRTLHELRTSLIEAETEIRGGAAMRISPFADVQDMSTLLQRAGFVMPVADTETITVRYSNPIKLFQDLRGMGETAASARRPNETRQPNLTRSILFKALEIYANKFSDKDGKFIATFEIVTASGWSPGPDQPKPLARGSAKVSLKDALNNVKNDDE